MLICIIVAPTTHHPSLSFYPIKTLSVPQVPHECIHHAVGLGWALPGACLCV